MTEYLHMIWICSGKKKQSLASHIHRYAFRASHRFGQSMKPFQGVTFCPTGLNDEYCSRSIAKKIVKLGGMFLKDLTRQVNVLVIGKTKDTNKYKFAVKHRYDITFVPLEAVETIYERWLTGEDLSAAPEMLRSSYSLPPLSGIYVFIGRVDPEICTVDCLEKMCRLQGCYDCNSAQFARNCITKNQGHLVVFISDSLHGTRARAAAEIGIPIIHPKWIIDCQRRNATLEYDPYYLVKRIEASTPLEQIGVDSCQCWKSLASSSMILRDNSSPATLPKAILRNKFKPQGDKLWQRAMSVGSTNAPLLAPPGELSAPEVPSGEQESVSHPIFEGASFEINPKFALHRSQILQKVIEQHAGTVKKSATYHIIPSNVPIEDIDGEIGGISVTEFFIERCLHYKRLIDPPDLWCKPFLHNTVLKLLPANSLLHNKDNILKVAITGFRGVELLHLTKLLETMEPMGLKFTEFLNLSTDLLLINLSSLPSIPISHPLWKNEYGNLFQLQAEAEESDAFNQVFRNSMKRKIEFVKQKHSIPVVTPAFLFDLLAHSSGSLKGRNATVYLNNINWCIICPRGTKDKFAIELVSKKRPHATAFSRKKSITSSIKETRFELLNKVNLLQTANATATKSISLDKQPSDEQHHKLFTKPMHSDINDRSASWGNLMSEEVINLKCADFDNIDSTPENVDLHYTQVTYGTSPQEMGKKRVRKLTRKHMRELGS